MLTDLSTRSIAQPLRRISDERLSGDLQIRVGRTVKTIFFDHGRIVFAGSNLRKDRLGEALVAAGRITADDFTRVQVVMHEKKWRLGDALVREGLIGKDELGRSIARQVRHIVLSLFELTEGVAAFEERRCPIPLEYMISISIHRLLYDGARLIENETILMNSLGNLDRRVMLRRISLFPYNTDECTTDELEIIQQAQRSITLRHLAWKPGGLTLARLRAVFALLVSGIIHDADASAEDDVDPGLQTETGTFLLSALQRHPDPSSREVLRREINQELDRSAQLDREAWLKVAKNATSEEIARVIKEKMERYYALLEAVGNDEDLRTDIELILGRVSSILRLARPARPAAGAGVPPPAAAYTATATKPHGAPPLPVEMRIANLRHEAELRMSLADYANAIGAYEALVQLAPAASEFHLGLAVAMACHPPKAKMAEREYIEALRLAPNNPDYHYRFGLYYKSMRERARAVIEMRAVLGLDPNHAGARAELTALAPNDGLLLHLRSQAH
ncbi:MAG: DUF4388 domain-containing protein [Vicinamibacteria bacterium]|nr:DUF4388 domain-containing protein [Vicinamibacteria bacterium]